MTPVIVDASFIAASLIRSQRTEAAFRMVEQWTDYSARAPYVLALETSWLLLKQERRSRERGLTRAALRDFEQLGIELAPAPDEEARSEALSLAIEFNMGLYDAMYLMLAKETSAALVSRDARLLAVAGELGASVIDVR